MLVRRGESIECARAFAHVSGLCARYVRLEPVAVGPVRLAEERVRDGVGLDVLPAGASPSAGHKPHF